MKRRGILLSTAFVAAALPSRALTQNPGSARHIGVLANTSAQPHLPAPIQALRQGVRDPGHVEGKNLKMEYRWGEGRIDRLPALAADLVRSRVELIVASGDGAIRAASAASASVSIVMATSGDAVGAGFVANLARPGGNVTAMTAINPERGSNRLQLPRELRPRALRMGVTWNPLKAIHGPDIVALQSAAQLLGVTQGRLGDSHA